MCGLLDIYRNRLHTSSDEIALVDDADGVTFADVDRRSDYVASIIRDRSNTSVIPFYLGRNINVLPTVIGILKAGRTPLPLVNALSMKKALGKVDEIDLDMVLTDVQAPKPLESVDIVNINNNSAVRRLSSRKNRSSQVYDDPLSAYIICTSGTTGRPKKVFITEENLVSILTTFYRLADFTEESKFLFTTPYTFDVSLTEIFAPIFSGGTLICCDINSSSLRDMNQVIVKYEVTHMSLSPSFAELVFETCGIKPFLHLKFLGVAGEKFPSSLANNLVPAIERGCRIFNLYGPSETTIYATYYELIARRYDHVPIGRPLEGVEVKLISDKSDAKLKELYIGGCGVTKGYLLQPELSAEKFRRIDTKTFYKTGDYVHYDDEGLLVFDERRDNQVQINGIRIELDGIKSDVLSVRGVRAVQVAYHKGKVYIFYKSRSDIKNLIVSELPNYIRPIVVKVDEFILNQNRKLDVLAMIERYYHTQDSQSKKHASEVISQILQEYGVRELADLDSLDTVRFFLDLEAALDITIDTKALSSLKCTDDIEGYLSKMDAQDKKGDTYTSSCRYDASSRDVRELDALVVGMGITNCSCMPIHEDINPTCTQAWFFDRGIRKFTCTEVPLLAGTFAELLQAKNTIAALAQDIDILRMIAIRHAEGLRFGLIDKEFFIPQIQVVTEHDITSLLEETLLTYEFFPVPLITYTPKDRTLRFYFAYHAIDAHSLHMLSHILYKAIRKSHFACKKSSFKDFRKYIEAANKNVTCDDLLCYMPQSEVLEFSPLDDKVQMISITKRDGQEPTQETSLYCVFQALMKEQEVKRVTGALSYDLRTFEGFDATNVLGDVHTKIPLFSKTGEDLTTFLDRFDACLAVYRKGIDLRWLATRKVRTNSAQVLETRWNTLNFSVNYLGMALDLKDALLNIKGIDFDHNFMNMFTHRDSMICVVRQRILRDSFYAIQSKAATYYLQTSIE